jgi:hypothetical protein
VAEAASNAPDRLLATSWRPSEYDTVLTLLRLTRIVAIVLTVVGFVVTVGAIVGPGFFGRLYLIGYPVIVAVANIFVYLEAGSIESLVLRGLYPPAKERLFLWTLIGLLAAGLVPGVLLLLAMMKLDPVINWQRAHGAVPEAVAVKSGSPADWGEGAPSSAPGLPKASGWSPARSSTPPSAPAAWVPPTTVPAAAVATPAPTPAPGSTSCPRCGRPATWIEQYSRWYCYSDRQYL